MKTRSGNALNNKKNNISKTGHKLSIPTNTNKPSDRGKKRPRDFDSDSEDTPSDSYSEYDEDEEEDFRLSAINAIKRGKKATYDNRQNIHPRIRVQDSQLPDNIKELALNRIKNIDVKEHKEMEWVDSLLSIPYGKYIPLPITVKTKQKKIQDFFETKMKRFNECVHGLEHVKTEIVNYLAQFITSGHKGVPRVLALCGSAGVGKTYIIKKALADTLNRPLKCINMGGIKDSKAFTGFEYTYSGARHGNILQCLMDSKVMNPIICFEEIDKISTTMDGNDIQYVLMHITDPEQNKEFQDNYFDGINFDLSNVIFVMTLNDTSILNPILLNRIHIINIPDPTLDDKVSIGQKHLIPNICKNIGFNQSLISFSDSIIKYMIHMYCEGDKGMRTLKRHLESIILRMNTIKLIGSDISGKLKVDFPINITETIVDTIIKSYVNKNSIHLSMYV